MSKAKSSGKKPYNKKDAEAYEDDVKAPRNGFKRKGKGSNSPEWYTGNQQLALDAGKFSFTWPTGASINFGVNVPGATLMVNDAPTNSVHFPGVMDLPFVPAYGHATEASDPLNVAMFNIYSFVRYKNSGHTNYEPSDLMLYLMAMDNIYMLYQHYVRAYGLLRVFSQRNRNYPIMLFNALNLDYEDLLAHMADFRYYINTVALRLSAMCVPATLPLYLRHMWMCSSVYADAPSVKSQVYIFRPAWVGKYEEKTSSKGGYLMGDSKLTTTKCNFHDLVALMEDLLNRVIQSEDCNIMSGDILKAYGDSNLFKVAQISEDYQVLPVFNTEVLRQIQNTTIIGSVGLDNYDSTPVLLYQDPDLGILKSSLTLTDRCVHIMGKRILTGSGESPSPEEVLVNTRLMVTSGAYTLSGTATANTSVSFDDPHYGTEIVTNARIYDYDNPAGVRVYYGANTGNTWTHEGYGSIARMEAYNYHPIVGREIQSYNDNALVAVYWYFSLGVDDYAIVDDHDVDKVHMTSLLSLFDVPQLGSSATK